MKPNSPKLNDANETGEDSLGDDFLWESCMHIMNMNHYISGNRTRTSMPCRPICTEGHSKEAYWPYERRIVFSLAYQQMPLAAKIATAMNRRTHYLSKGDFPQCTI